MTANDLSLHFLEGLAEDLRRATAAAQPAPRASRLRGTVAALLGFLSLGLVSGV